MKKGLNKVSRNEESNQAFDSALYKQAKYKQSRGEPLLEKEKEILKKYLLQLGYGRWEKIRKAS